MYAFEDKFAFIAHPRTGSRSTRNALTGLGCERVCGHHEVDHEWVQRVLDADGIVGCTIRNMFDVLVSWYYKSRLDTRVTGYVESVVPVEGFTEWFNTIMDGGHQYIDVEPYFYGHDEANWVIPWEELQMMFPIMLDAAGMPEAQLSPTGVSNRVRDYRPYYTPSTRQRVEDRWGHELERTGYHF